MFILLFAPKWKVGEKFFVEKEMRLCLGCAKYLKNPQHVKHKYGLVHKETLVYNVPCLYLCYPMFKVLIQ